MSSNLSEDSPAEFLASRLYGLTHPQRIAWLAEHGSTLSDADLYDLEFDWRFWARPEQRMPGGDFAVWLIRAGRQSGKTRAAAEAVREAINWTDRIALVAPTANSARMVMWDGESGLARIFPPTQRPTFEPTKLTITFHNGARAFLFSGEEPERLRGPAHGFAWVDELRAFRYEAESWMNLKMGMTIGRYPRIVVSTTPRPSPIIRQLIKQAADGNGEVVETRMTTYDNRANLPPSYLSDMIAEYEGTRLGRQELHAELLEDVEGALLTLAHMEAALLERSAALGEYDRVVIGIDPSTGSGLGDECGIVVAAVHEGIYYILADLTIRGSPAEWGKAVVAAVASWRPDRVVCEEAFGQKALAQLVVDPLATVPWRWARVHHSKEVRAEPVAALYERGLVRHVGAFPKLEEDWTTWVPPSRGGSREARSPDHLDAACGALQELMVKPRTMARVGHIGERLWTERETGAVRRPRGR